MNPLRVLFVDDDPGVLSAHERTFRKKFAIDTAQEAAAALAFVKRKDTYAVIVADMRMPGISGIEFLAQARVLAPDTVRLVLTGDSDRATAVEAINQGNVYRFLTKPCPPEMLELCIEEGFRQYQLVTAERRLLEETLAGSVRMLVETLSLVEPQAFGTGEKVRDYARRYLAAHPVDEPWAVEIAALLSQIGFVTVPPGVAAKARRGLPLTPEEAEMAARVPVVGHGLMQHIPRLGGAARMVLYHGKDYDGGGIPDDAVRGAAIPLGARLVKILLELVRQEEQGHSPAAAVRRMRTEPHRFDPALLAAVRDSLGIAAAEVSAAPAPASAPGGGRREIGLAELHVGDRLLEDVVTLAGLTVVREGSEITPLLLQRIANFGAAQGVALPIVVKG